MIAAPTLRIPAVLLQLTLGLSCTVALGGPPQQPTIESTVKACTELSGRIDANLNPGKVSCKPSAKPPKLAQRKGGFAEVLLSSHNAELISSLGNACGWFLVNNVYRPGGSLASEALSSLAVPLNRLTDRPAGNRVFHWTRSPDFHQSMTRGSPDYLSISLHLKSRDLRQNRSFGGKVGLWSRVFYVAGDRQSSRGYGSHLIQFTVSEKASVLDLKSPEKVYGYQQLPESWPSILKDLESRFPGFSAACEQWIDQEKETLLLLVADDSGIDIIQYSTGPAWFQVLNPEIFLKSEKSE